MDEATNEVMGAAIDVHKTLGPGFLESVYEEARAMEPALRGVPFRRQRSIALNYKGSLIGEGRLDLLVRDSLIFELTTVDALRPIHTAQVLPYWRMTRLSLGPRINFNVRLLRDGIRRIRL